MTEQELLEKVKDLMAVRSAIIALKERQQDIEAQQRKLDKEWLENSQEITALGEKGHAIVKELVFG